MKNNMLVQDESCHWYLIPAIYAEDWEETYAFSEDMPSWAIPVDGPRWVTFDDYEIA